MPGALEIYDRVLHHDGSADVALELVDASSLLWRLHLEGEAVGDRWRSLAQAWGRELTPGYYPFNDVHAAMAFIGAGDLERGRELVADLEAVVETGDRETTAWVMTGTVGLPVCRGLVAFGEGDYAQVLDELWPVRTRLHEFGGSHAQRDAVERTLLEAAIRADRSDVARALVNERLGVREFSTYAWSKCAQVLAAEGDGSGASAAAERARVLADEILAARSASRRPIPQAGGDQRLRGRRARPGAAGDRSVACGCPSSSRRG